MLKQIINRFLRHRHFWRVADFDELSEVYTSMMIRSLSISMTGIFVPLYMLRLGYPTVSIMASFAWYFVARAVLFDYLAGYLTARYGPKHTMLGSYFLIILSTAMFLTLPSIAWPLWLLGAVWGGSTSLFTIPLGIDFSKVRHKAHSGKELGYISIMDRSGAIIGPIVGGIVATLFGGQYIFLVAMILLLLGAYPLLKTSEPLPTHQKLNLNLVNLKAMKADLISYTFYSIELTLTNWAWPLYLSLFVLSGAVYAKLGALASIAVIAALVSAYAIGRLVDRQRGRLLLRFSASANAGLHIYRIFVTTYPAAFLVNILNEAVTIGYHLPYNSGLYNATDERGEHRAAYMVIIEIVGSSIKALVWILMIILTTLATDNSVLKIGFVIAAVSSLLIMTEKFTALNRKA